MIMLPNGKATAQENAEREDEASEGFIPDVALIKRTERAISKAVKNEVNLTREVFSVVRSCESLPMAAATFTFAEQNVLKAEQVDSMQALAAKYGVASVSSYQQAKSNILNGVRREDELRKQQQSWLNWKETHDGDSKVVLSDSYLNIWSNRYEGAEGHTMYMRDYREASAAKRLRDAAEKKLAKKAGTAGTATVTEITPAQVASGESGKLPDSIRQALSSLVREVQDVAAILSEDFICKTLNGAMASLVHERKDVQRKVMEASSAATSKPSKAVAESKKAKQLPEVPAEAPKAAESAA
jgi:hypothetical protein